jgi:hypothetical protein
MGSDGTTGTIDAFALLAIPDPGTVSEAQVRGKACVWCAATLVAETAVDLGPRRKPVLDSSHQWFPRGCRTCTAAYALRALHDHAPRCEQCTDDPACCDAGRALRRLSLGRQP